MEKQQPSPPGFFRPPTDRGSSSGSGSDALREGGSSAYGEGSRGSTGADDPTRVSGSAPAPGADLSAAQAMVAGYELVSELHRGGQGVVYRAVQLGTKRPVALKVLLEGPFASEATRRRFEREVELAASLRHPNIVAILDSGISQGRHYLAMELIEGLRLDHYLKRHAPPLPRVIELLAEVAEAVNFAHQRGVIHRDLKPSNILVDEEGRPHVLDFGLAKEQRTADSGETTIAVVSTTGQVIGTVAFMSPEQAAGSPEVDVRSDVYSLGVVFYDALLGRPPYQVHGALGDVLQRIVHEEPARPRSARSGSRFGRMIDDELETILLKALEKEPARRYQSAGDLARDLRHYLAGEPVEAKRASGLYMLRKMLRRYRWQAAAGLALLVGLIAFLVVLAGMYSRERDARRQVEQLTGLLRDKAVAAEGAARDEADARREAEETAELLTQASTSLKRALVWQRVQRGNLALMQNDLPEARDSFWEAMGDESHDAIAHWALRHYYTETGDSGAMTVAYSPSGPAAFSPGAGLVAFCETPRRVLICSTVTGEVSAWLPMLQDVLALSVADDGTLAAAGSFWAGVWKAGEPAPRALVDVNTRVRPEAVFAHGNLIVLVGERRVLVVDTASGGRPREMALHGAVAGAPILSPEGALIVPTTAGVESVVLDIPGSIPVTVAAANGRTPVRVVRQTDGGRLVLLADSLQLVDPRQPAETVSRIMNDATGWDFMDIRQSDGTVVLGRRDGLISVLRPGAAAENRTVTKGALIGMRLSPDGETVITLDERGVLTRWATTLSNPRGLVHDKLPTAWAASMNGSTVSFVDADGRIISCVTQADGGPRLRGSRLPTLLNFLPGSSAGDVELALRGDGRLLAVRQGNRVWLETGFRRSRPLEWNHPDASNLNRIAMSPNGGLLALYARSAAGDEQLVYFTPIARGLGFAQTLAPGLPRPAAASVRFVGSALRDMLFLPGLGTLAVARSNGELMLLRPEPGESPTREEAIQGVRPPAAWAVMDSPPVRLAVDRDARLLAVACEDGAVRVLAIDDGSEKGRVSLAAGVTSLSFSAAGDALLIRTVDGALNLYDVESLERLTRWSFAGGGAAPMAVWAGRDDALLLTESGGVYEHNFRRADPLIAQNRAFGLEREVARRLQENQPLSAWNAAIRMLKLDPRRGRDTQIAVLAALLRKTGHEIPGEWIREVQDAAADQLLRLGHAAFEGGRFELARTLLRKADAQDSVPADTLTRWRLAECDYVLNEPGPAAEALRALLAAPGLGVPQAARLRTELAAALFMSGRDGEAAAVLRGLESLGQMGERGSTIDQVAAIIVVSRLLDQGEANRWSATLQAMLSQFRERWLPFRDDIEFFLGERARRAGDHATARSQYQLCIDIASDEWPSAWARHRLGEPAAP